MAKQQLHLVVFFFESQYRCFILISTLSTGWWYPDQTSLSLNTGQTPASHNAVYASPNAYIGLRGLTAAVWRLFVSGATAKNYCQPLSPPSSPGGQLCLASLSGQIGLNGLGGRGTDRAAATRRSGRDRNRIIVDSCLFCDKTSQYFSHCCAILIVENFLGDFFYLET